MRALIPLVLLTTAACQEYDLKNREEPEADVYPDILVDPPSIEFDQLGEGETAIDTFTITNVGEAELTVSDVSISVGADAFSILSDTSYALLPEESVEVEVEFAPFELEHYGTAEVASDDPDTPVETVDLLGLGTPPDTPVLQITPESHNFGETFVPCGSSVELEMKNVGSADLEITDVEYESGGLLTFDNNGVGLPLTLAPQDFVTVFVDFEAVTEGSDTGTLSVTSNDPRGVITADQNGEGAYSEYTTESFTEPGRAPVDIIMLVDQSGSMGENKPTVRNGIPDFLDELQNVSDWRMMVVTKGGGCYNDTLFDQYTKNAEDRVVDAAFAGAGGLLATHTEALLKHGKTTLDKTVVGECNEGFLRSGALLHLIMISDEADQSPNSWSHWVSQYETFVPDPALVKVSAIVDVNSTSCGNPGSGYAVGPDGYIDAAQATGGEVLDICDPNWGDDLDDIAAAAVAGIRSYNLEYVTDESTIEVTVNGKPTTDFDYEPAGSTVTINSPAIGEKDVVEITYAVPGNCDEN